MNVLQQDSVTIHRLRIRGSAQTGGAGLARIGGVLQRELVSARWPEAPGESWVFIRQVRAQGPLDRLGEALLSATRSALAHGDGDILMRFDSLAELLAALLEDLINGRAAGRWYWRRWSQLFQLPPSQCIRHLLLEHLDLLPSICTALSRRQMLTLIWQALEMTDARFLLGAMAQRNGFSIAASETAPAAVPASESEPPALPLSPGTPLWRQWSEPLRRLPAEDARFQLALALIGQQLFPQMLRFEPATLFARLTRQFHPAAVAEQRARPHPPSPTAGEGALPMPSTRPDPALPDATLSGANAVPRAIDQRHTATAEMLRSTAGDLPEQLHVATAANAADFGAAVTGEVAQHAAGNASASPPPSAVRNTATQPHSGQLPNASPPAAGEAVTNSQTALQEFADDTDFAQFRTAQGGLLYLLNFLNRPQVQMLMEANWRQLPGGWGWLYRLGQTLQLDENDPIVRFLALSMGLAQHELAQLAPLPARERLLELAADWYGADDLWQPELLRLDASVHATPSHLDLYASLADVRLPLRLAGLDLNPGWLPWLGRVVRFHYD